jgi:hypothetical protein
MSIQTMLKIAMAHSQTVWGWATSAAASNMGVGTGTAFRAPPHVNGKQTPPRILEN